MNDGVLESMPPAPKRMEAIACDRCFWLLRPLRPSELGREPGSWGVCTSTLSRVQAMQVLHREEWTPGDRVVESPRNTRCPDFDSQGR